MNSASSLTRRQFVAKSAGAAAAFAILSQPKSGAAAPNSKIVVGIMGLGGRGSYLAQAFASRPDTDIAYICDADTRRFRHGPAGRLRCDRRGVPVAGEARRHHRISCCTRPGVLRRSSFYRRYCEK